MQIYLSNIPNMTKKNAKMQSKMTKKGKNCAEYVKNMCKICHMNEKLI